MNWGFQSKFISNHFWASAIEIVIANKNNFKILVLYKNEVAAAIGAFQARLAGF